MVIMVWFVVYHRPISNLITILEKLPKLFIKYLAVYNFNVSLKLKIFHC